MSFSCFFVFSLLYMLFTVHHVQWDTYCPMTPKLDDSKGIPTYGNVENYCKVVL
uniref:Uncharacterized protein n=1 Tax=Rhinopithecus bieti TaxID=61621 RepID=A0A2K6JQU6_RHIBE